MKVQFYILGLLLRYGPQHGYHLKQIVEEQISDFAKIKLPTIYYHLEKLEENRHVTASFDKDGNRPEKTVYSITDEGTKYFYVLLKKMQAEELHLELPFDGVLFFRERISNEEFSGMLKNAIQVVEIKLNQVLAHRDITLRVIPDIAKANTQAIFNHHIYHLRAELEWLKEQEKEFGD
jgi:DNA-binding PadR family transcriptional regulator